MYRYFFIHSSTDGHLGCFLILAIINYIAINVGVHIYSFELVFRVSSGIFSEVDWLGYKAVPFLIFWGNLILLSLVAAPVCIPINNSAQGFFFLHILCQLVVHFFDDSRFDRYEVISHWVLIFSFLWWLVTSSIFSYMYFILCLFRSFAHF